MEHQNNKGERVMKSELRNLMHEQSTLEAKLKEVISQRELFNTYMDFRKACVNLMQLINETQGKQIEIWNSTK